MQHPIPEIEADIQAIPKEFRSFLDNAVDNALQAARDSGLSRLDAMLVLIYVGRRANQGIQAMPEGGVGKGPDSHC